MDDRDVLVRASRLRPELMPVDIIGPAGPLPVDWLAVTWSLFTSPGTFQREAYVLFALTDDGDELETLLYDTLDIALDQAHAIFGVELEEWRTCEVDLPPGTPMKWSLADGGCTRDHG
jgi:hypothetical protein